MACSGWPVLLLLGVLVPDPVASILQHREACDENENPQQPTTQPTTTWWHRSLLAARERVGEFVAPWALGVTVCVFASVMAVCGFVLQKKAVMWDSGSSKYFHVFSITLSPTWMLGFLLVTLATFPCDLLAYSLAPLSLTAPLSGFTVVMNQVVAPFLLNEKVQPWPDVAACVVIVCGIMLTTSAGNHQEETKITMARLIHLSCDYVFLGTLLVLLVVVWACIVRIEFRRHASVLHVRDSKDFHVAFPAIVAAGAGGVSNILLKALGELLKNGDTWQQCLWCSALCLIPALVQLNFVNMGLRLYAQTLFIPVYSALLVVTNTFYGAVFYQEYSSLLIDSGRGACFCFGVALIVAGLVLLMQKRPEESWIVSADCQRAG